MTPQRSLAKSVAGSLAGTVSGSLAGGPPGALGILGANAAFGVDVDRRVMGAGDDITTLVDYVNNASPTQGVAADRPHLVDVDGIAHAEFVALTDQFLRVDSPLDDLWAAGETDVNAWLSLRYDDPAATDFSFEFSPGAAQAQGLGTTSLTASLFRSQIHTTGVGLQNTDATDAGIVNRQVYRWSYDAANFTIFSDDGTGSVQLAQEATTGGMTNACTRVTIGRGADTAGPLNAIFRALWLAVGPLSAQQVFEMDDFMRLDAGI